MPHTCTSPAGDNPDAAHWAETLIHSRRTTLPKRLTAPGPDAQQRQAILHAASCAPDHGPLLPWRFIEVPETQRSRLASVFAQALLERDANAAPGELEQAREKAYRSPWLLLAVGRVRGGDPDIAAQERLLSAGAAIQNMLLMGTAMGFGSSLTSGKALQSTPFRKLFELQGDEDALCFINIGTIQSHRAPRTRPAVSDFYRRLGE